MRKTFGILLSVMMLCAGGLTGYSQTPDPTTECPHGLVCLTPDEARQLRATNLDLRASIVKLRQEVGILKATKLRRFGHNVGCGGGLAVVDGDGTWEMGVYCGYMFGYRF